MDLFDLHCDTISKCLELGKPLYDGDLDFNFKKAQAYGRRCQTMAAFIPDKYCGKDALRHYKRLKNCLYNQLEINREIAVLCRGSNEVETAVCEDKQAVVFSVENAAALGGDIENVEMFYNDGVRIMSLTWNGDNELAGGIKGNGLGLTAFGKAVVNKMAGLKMIVDVSHLSDRGFDEIYDMGVEPIVATHSNLRSVKDNVRNLTDERFLKIVERGGVAGLNFYVDFLGDEPFEYAWRHVYRMLSLGGEDNISIGSDFDGADFDERIDSVEKIEMLADYFLAQGLDEKTLCKIMFNNALRVLGE